MEVSFSHVGLTCAEPDVIEDFYCRFFSFRRARVFNTGKDQIVMLKSGSVYLELFKSTRETEIPKAGSTGQEYPGWKHICFTVDNLDAKLEEMGDAAVVTHGPLELNRFVPGMRAVWIADPEGNIIELNQGYYDE